MAQYKSNDQLTTTVISWLTQVTGQAPEAVVVI